MHCPLCTVAEVYQDPVILRAHFHIKHVDKSIDFAGQTEKEGAVSRLWVGEFWVYVMC